jgi:hypothetical protein
MFFLITLLAELVLFIVPIITLPLALSLSYNGMLRISFAFALVQGILGTIKVILKKTKVLN